MSNRLFETMMKHGGPGAVGVAERPFHHPHDYIWRYFVDLATTLESKMVRYRSLVDDLERQILSLIGANGAAGVGAGATAAATAETMSPQSKSKRLIGWRW